MDYASMAHVRHFGRQPALDHLPVNAIRIGRPAVQPVENVMPSARSPHVRHDICDFHFHPLLCQRFVAGADREKEMKEYRAQIDNRP
jgi:hypothetical protein